MCQNEMFFIVRSIINQNTMQNSVFFFIGMVVTVTIEPKDEKLRVQASTGSKLERCQFSPLEFMSFLLPIS